MQDDYAVTGEPRPQRSTFDVSEKHKTTFNASYIIPFYWDLLYPDEVRRSTTRAFVRISNPLDYPLMDNLYVTVHWMTCAIRNLWDNGRKFFGERLNPGDSINYTIPVMGSTSVAINGDTTWHRLCDHLGLPHVSSFNLADAMSLPFRMYNQCYNYQYRDQSIQNSVWEQTDDGPDTNPAVNYNILQRGKRFDYFTNLTPAPQRGDSVTIGGEISAPQAAGGNPAIYSEADAGYRLLDANAATLDVSATASSQSQALFANTTINELRNAVAITQFLERDNRSGQLFGDIIKAHFGANFTDAKYMPVYVAGGRAPLIVTPISNQAQSATEDLGDLGAIGSGVFEGASFTYIAEEWEILMGFIMVDADLTYHQGLNRKWSYRTRYELIWSEFEGIGDQACLLKEIFYQNTADDENVLGYSPRYEEGRIGINRVSREFRSDYATPLDSWHVAQDFVAAPSLDDTYIKASVPMGRVVKNSNVDHFLADIHTEMHSTKALSMRGIPGLARL